VWTFAAKRDGAEVAASIVRGSVEQVRLRVGGLNGSTREAERAIRGIPLHSVAQVLGGFGEPGRRLAAAFVTAEAGRL
jgi:hypothetical protein